MHKAMDMLVCKDDIETCVTQDVCDVLLSASVIRPLHDSSGKNTHS